MRGLRDVGGAFSPNRFEVQILPLATPSTMRSTLLNQNQNLGNHISSRSSTKVSYDNVQRPRNVRPRLTPETCGSSSSHNGCDE